MTDDLTDLIKSLSLFEGNELALYQVAAELGNIDSKPEPKLRDDTIGFLRPLLRDGWLEAGRVLTRDPSPWVPVAKNDDEVLETVRRIWDEENRQPTLLDDIWFRLTDKGLQLLQDNARRRKHRRCSSKGASGEG